MDSIEDIEEVMQKIKDKIIELDQLHKKHLLPGFNEDNPEAIDSLTAQITALFQKSQKKIQAIQTNQTAPDSKSAQIIGKNVQISLATKLQELSTTFRKSQNTYLAKLRGRETKIQNPFMTVAEQPEDDDLDAVFTDVQMQELESNERTINQRSQDITKIADSINALGVMFKELQTMVIDQGTILDRIDYNIEQTHVYVQDAHAELVKAHKYQDNRKAKLCIMFLGIVVAILLLVVIFKPRRK